MMAPYVPVLAARSCHRFHEGPFAALPAPDTPVLAFEVTNFWALEAAPAPERSVGTVEKIFHTELMFWYWEKAPYANMERERPLYGVSKARRPLMRGNISFDFGSWETGRFSRTENNVSAATNPLQE